jgi:transposase InsO family protein
VTRVRLWGLWPADVLVIIDHFSRKLVQVRPLVSLSSPAICYAFEETFPSLGPPKHLITDRGFDSGRFADFLKSFEVKQRFGAVGQHGSIAVTERVNRTLKEEWLRRVPVIRGHGHLAELCAGFVLWYNEWRRVAAAYEFAGFPAWRRLYTVASSQRRYPRTPRSCL